MLNPAGVTFGGRRDAGEQRTEFLASADNWFRPVQVRSGPDGALYVVDMYRFVVEHPRWIPPDRLKQVDIRAGADMGRIYRVVPKEGRARRIPRMDQYTPVQLALALGETNGALRDLAHRELAHRRERGPWKPEGISEGPREILSALAANAPSPASRAQAMAVLAQSNEISAELNSKVLADKDANVRRLALRFGERLLQKQPIDPGLLAVLRKLGDDATPSVRVQLALSLGECRDPVAGDLLAKLAQTEDRWVRGAVLSSSAARAFELLEKLQTSNGDEAEALSFARQLIASAARDSASFKKLFAAIGKAPDANRPAWSLGLLGTLLEAAERRNEPIGDYASALEEFISTARKLAADTSAPVATREAAMSLLGRPGSSSGRDAAVTASEIEILLNCLEPGVDSRLRQAGLGRLRKLQFAAAPALMLEGWDSRPPSQRAGIVGVLVSREEWAGPLLSAVKHGRISALEIPLADRQTLLKHRNTAIRESAEKLFERNSNRVGVIEKYRDVGSITGRVGLGAAVFEKNCAQCHLMRGRGHEVGPNLAEFAGKGAQDYVLAIMDPNAGINPNFIAYNVETKDGRSLTGIVRGETATGLTLVQGGGLKEAILRSDIREMKASTLSLMPEGMEQAMTPQDVADLIAWLKQGGSNTDQKPAAQAAAGSSR